MEESSKLRYKILSTLLSGALGANAFDCGEKSPKGCAISFSDNLGKSSSNFSPT